LRFTLSALNGHERRSREDNEDANGGRRWAKSRWQQVFLLDIEDIQRMVWTWQAKDGILGRRKTRKRKWGNDDGGWVFAPDPDPPPGPSKTNWANSKVMRGGKYISQVSSSAL
jgi:hypothetical protein